MKSAARRLPMGELLVESGELSREQLDFALIQQRRGLGRLGELLVAARTVSEAQVATALATQSGRPFMPDARLFELEPEPKLLAKVRQERARQLHVLPLVDRDRTTWVASSEPETPDRSDLVRFLLGSRAVRWLLVTPSALRVALAWAYRGVA